MKKSFKAILSALALTFCLAGNMQILNFAKVNASVVDENGLGSVKNVIIMIGDGMGPNQVKAGEIYKGAPLYMQTMSQSVFSATASASDAITDSAAAGTALATGVRTNNSMVGLSPQSEELTTIMDIALEKGKRTGVVTTDVLSGATPMSFAAHNGNRNASAALLASAANSGVNLFVANSQDSITEFTDESGNIYEDISNVDDISNAQSDYVIGDYSIKASAPSMSAENEGVAFDRVVRESLEYLSKDPDGFVLMAEGARIDKCSHANDFNGMISELLAFDDAVKVAMDWASERNDTLVIVTADHETGGLQIAEGATKENLSSSYQWTTTGHTDADVYCNIYGREVDFSRFSSISDAGRVKNTDIFQIAKMFVQEGKHPVDVQLVRKTVYYATVEFDKELYFFGDTLRITIIPKASYELESLKLNDVEMISKVENNVLEYKIDEMSVAVDAKFRKVTSNSFDIYYESLGDKGTYELNPTSVENGEKLVVKINPADGYAIDKVIFNDVEMEKTQENTYEIVVTNAGTVKVTFKEELQKDLVNDKTGCSSTFSLGAVNVIVLVGAVGILLKRKTVDGK